MTRLSGLNAVELAHLLAFFTDTDSARVSSVGEVPSGSGATYPASSTVLTRKRRREGKKESERGVRTSIIFPMPALSLKVSPLYPSMQRFVFLLSSFWALASGRGLAPGDYT